MFKISTGILTSAHLLCTALSRAGSSVARMFYAVRKGRNPGVYNTWAECKEQVDRFPAARYKKFASEEEAWRFVGEIPEVSSSLTESSSKDQSSSNVKPSYSSKRPLPCTTSTVSSAPKRTKLIDISSLPPLLGQSFSQMGMWQKDLKEGRQISGQKYREARNYSSSGSYNQQGRSADVYTDGCCINNGRYGARGGIGVNWGPENPLNVSERSEGRPTNQRAELQAARRALEQARDNNITRLNLHTDSEYTVKGMTDWMPRWKENGWKTYTGGDVANKAEFQALDRLCEGIDVNWRHVPGHSGNSGNEMADYLARSGAWK